MMICVLRNLQKHTCKKSICCKIIPAGATTNSSKGVKNISNIFKLLEAMTKIKMPLLIHEVNDKKIDVFDREKVSIEQYLQK